MLCASLIGVRFVCPSSPSSPQASTYPQDPLARNAQFYIGEINYRQGKYPAAVKGYDAVLEQYSGNARGPAAELRKGQSLIQMGQKDAEVRELRILVQRYPPIPEARKGEAC